MRILHLAPWPGPPFDGGRIIRLQFLRRLCARHPSRFLVSHWESTPITADSMAGLGIHNEGVEEVSIPRFMASGRFRGLLGDLPPGVAFLRRRCGEETHAKLSQLIRAWRPDLLMVWSANWAWVAEGLTGSMGKVLFACDSMSMLNRNMAAASRNIFEKLYRIEMARRYARYERLHFCRYDRVIFASSRDAQAADLPPQVPVEVVPFGVDTEELYPDSTPASRTRLRIVFHGSLSYRANHVCAQFLAEHVGPRLERELGLATFEIRLVGRGASCHLERLAAQHSWLTLTGYVERMRDELARGDIYAAPLTMGAGIKTKILEAMACGLPIVATPEAFEGVPIEAGKDALICPLREITPRLASLMVDPQRRASLGKAARTWVEKHLCWEKIADRLEAVCLRAHRHAA